LRSSRGSALLIVLAFVVLFTGIVVAFFSRTMADRKFSASSASQTQVELLAQGAIASILGDLKQEIADGSTVKTITTGNVTTTIYTPATPANAVPALVGSNGAGGLENLIKRSANGLPFHSGVSASNRASSASTTSPSLNGRFISPARWNSPLLLPAKSATDTTPLLTSGNFTSPDWVLVSRDGSNPVSWSTNLKWSSNATRAVIGRYAYTIYDEGGVLDMNVAGYPASAATSSSASLAGKGALAFADLTQLPLTSGSLSQTEVDKLIAWRNAGSATSGSGYINSVLNNTKGFLTVASASDRAFLNRQQLIRFLTSGNLSVSKADGQKLLQYMGTFSRDLNQPSFAPDTNRPKIVSGAINYTGGNNQYQLDDLANPAFAAVRVGTSFTRNDGSTALVGEPLVKKRFALNRLAWLTCKGPSAPRKSSTDADITALKAAGITEDWLGQGTDSNILKYFGLSWDNTNKRWTYSHGDPGKGICCLPELITGIVDPGRGSGTIAGAPREPDFFELIKAAINVGSLGKAFLSMTSVNNSYQALRDTNVNEQIIQIGANIIDQYDSDGYPTRIWYAGAAGSGHEFRGVEDLPYIYRVRTHAVQISPPVPNVSSNSTSTVTAAYNSANNTVQSGAAWVPFTDTGLAASILLPEIWNPHDGSRPLPSMMPSEFHVTADTTDPDFQLSYCKVNAFSITTSANTTIRSDSLSPTTLTSAPFNAAWFQPPSNQVALYGSGPNQNNDIQFNVNDTRQFREPTALFIPGKPDGSNLRYGPKDWVVGGSSFGTSTPSVPLNADGTAIVESGSGNPYLGICVGVAPLAWISKISGNYTYVKMAGTSPHSGITSGGITYHLSYMDPFGTLRIYDEKYSGYTGLGAAYVPGNSGFAWPASAVVGRIGSPRLDGGAGCLMVFADPRTRRWGAGMLNGSLSGPIIPQPTTQPHPIPSPVCLPWRQNESSVGQILTSANAPFYPYNQTGWYPATASTTATGGALIGLTSQNNPNTIVGAKGPAAWSNLAGFYTDPDGVARRAMGAFVPFTATAPASTPIGLPNVVASVVETATALCTPPTTSASYASTSTININVSPGQNLGRPIVLNRPFKSVGELAYTFSDTPWRNLDLSTPESGNSALLDAFCIQDDSTPDAVIAGKVNLNTRQAPVLKALLAGAAKQDDGTSAMSATDVSTIAGALIARTTGNSTASGQGPLRNPAELVGRYISGNGTSAIYKGFSEDVAVNPPSPLSSVGSSIQRFRETAIRAFSSVGTTRVWNLMIDVFAQTGRYPQSATSLDQFLVEGEKRYWLHVAIDRCTGEVLDQQLEPVTE
jgi:hypothetical protein